jgi:hypothetical protein
LRYDTAAASGSSFFVTDVNSVNPAAPSAFGAGRVALGRRTELIVLAGLVVVFVVAARALRFTVDDAYIAMRYARNLAEGRGLVYNAGEHVEGFTSPLWVLILAAAHLVGSNMVSASHAVGVATSIAVLALVYRMADRALPSEAILGRLIPVAFLATSWIFAGWATGGLETALHAFLVVLGVSELQARAMGQGDRRDWLPAIGLLIVLTRPDGLLLAGLLGLSSLLLDYRARRPTRRTIAHWVVVFALPLAAIEVWRLSYYGKWLPNTFYVKVNKVEYIDRGWPFFVSFVRDSYAYLWGPVALAALLTRDPTAACILVYGVLYVAYTIWVGGDWMGYRFYSHLLALVSFPIALVTGGAVRRFTRSRRTALQAAAVAAMVVTVAATSYKMYREGRDTVLTMSELDSYEEMDTPEAWAIDVARGLNTVLRPGEAASASFAGFTAVYTDRVVVDSLGLADAYVASLPAVRGGPGHEKIAPSDYLRSRQVLLVNPWPGSTINEANRRFALRYAPGDYLFFDALLPPARIAEILTPRGYDVWVDGRMMFDRSSVSDVSTGLNLDFERGTWDDWTVEGDAFGSAPGEGSTWDNSSRITGVQGQYFVNTYSGNSDVATGTARSADFALAGDTIHFLLAGGASERTALELWVDGRRVRASSGQNSEDLLPLAWDVAEFRGRRGYLVIRDDEPAGWGHIVVDDIRIGDRRSRID